MHTWSSDWKHVILVINHYVVWPSDADESVGTGLLEVFYEEGQEVKVVALRADDVSLQYCDEIGGLPSYLVGKIHR